MAELTCSICGHNEFDKNFYFGQFKVECCAQCGHGVTRPSLTAVELDRLYNSEYFDNQHEQIDPGEKAFALKIGQEKHRIKRLRRHLSGGRVLDVGCGLGFFLYACKKKYGSRYAPNGFEVSSSNKEYIEEKLGIPLYLDDNDLSASVLAKGNFGAITFWHSLEHFSNPKSTLEYFLTLLDAHGVLIIDVPAYNSIDAYIQGVDWEGWQIPYHQHHFTQDSLSRLLDSVGMTIVDKHAYSSSHIYNCLKNTWCYALFAGDIASYFRGQSMVVVCKRKKAEVQQEDDGSHSESSQQ